MYHFQPYVQITDLCVQFIISEEVGEPFSVGNSCDPVAIVIVYYIDAGLFNAAWLARTEDGVESNPPQPVRERFR